MTALLLGLPLSGLVAWYVVRPLMQPEESDRAAEERSERESLLDEKQSHLQALRELDLDRSLGKISDEEYGRGREAITRELVALMKKLKS